MRGACVVAVLLALASVRASEDEFVTVLLSSDDFHVTHNHDFVAEMAHDNVALLEIHEDFIKDSIVAQHSTPEAAREHMMSFLEEESAPASPLQPQYIFGTAFPPTLYHHLMSDFPNYQPPKAPALGELGSAIHSASAPAKREGAARFANPSTLQPWPLLAMYRSPALPLNAWGTYTHYGFPGPLLM